MMVRFTSKHIVDEEEGKLRKSVTKVGNSTVDEVMQFVGSKVKYIFLVKKARLPHRGWHMNASLEHLPTYIISNKDVTAQFIAGWRQAAQ